MYHPHRNSVSSSRNSWADSESDDDIITPCPPEHIRSTERKPAASPVLPAPAPSARPRTRRRASTASRQESEAKKAVDDYDLRCLWRCMLELQRRYGCYKSARMQAAASMYENSIDLMPSRACIELLNESIEGLPEEGRELLERYLPRDHGAARSSRRHGWRFWRH